MKTTNQEAENNAHHFQQGAAFATEQLKKQIKMLLYYLQKVKEMVQNILLKM